MSYLTLYALRRPASARPALRGARVDERTLLNLPGFDGDAHVRVFVEDTSAHRVRRRRRPSPRLRLRITDCSNPIHLEFSLETPEHPRELAAQDRHADRRARALPFAASQAEAELRARRERPLTLTKGGRDVVPEATRHASRAAVGAAPGVGPGAELGRRLRLGGRRTGRGCAASSSSARRAAATTRREWKLTRENAKAVEGCLARGRPAHGRRDRRASSQEGRAPKNDPALFALAMAAGRRTTATRRAALDGAAAGVPHRHAPVPVRAVRRGLPRLGPLAAARGRPLVRRAAGRRARLPGGQVPPARGRDAPRPAPARPPGGSRRAPATRRSTSRTSTLACSSGSSAAARPTACRAWSRASRAPRRRRRRARRRSSSASTGLPREARASRST